MPDRIQEYTDGQIVDNGYDYLDNDEMGIWLDTDDAEQNVEKVIELIKSEQILDNDLSRVAEIYISEEDCATLDQCRVLKGLGY